jgi:hypothetical protein
VIRKRQETFVKQTHLKIEAEEAEAGISILFVF